MNNDIHSFIEELTPDDVGNDTIGDNIVYFEGFVEPCWEDAQSKGHTQESLEKEMLDDWAKRNGGLELIESGWTNGCEPFEDTIFYAVYR